MKIYFIGDCKWKYTIIDTDKLEYIRNFSWSIDNLWYISNWYIRLHQFIYWKINKWNHIDHINWNKIDNRIINLREVSVSENNHNSKYSRWLCKYRWVSYDNTYKKYISMIMVNWKTRRRYFKYEFMANTNSIINRLLINKL